jgi:membrane protein involved in colicin uptake
VEPGGELTVPSDLADELEQQGAAVRKATADAEAKAKADAEAKAKADAEAKAKADAEAGQANLLPAPAP